MTIRVFRAGSSVEDYCRACKADRIHTVVAADAAGQPIRVSCGYCRSEHNYRGGPRTETATSASDHRAAPAPRAEPDHGRASPDRSGGRAPHVQDRADLPVVSERELMHPDSDLELMLRRVIREETGITPVAPAKKFRGGTLVLKPADPALQDKSMPIETFFHKIVMLRNRLRTLEQQVNASDLPEDAKIKLQSYVSGCYGSLTSFNVLFADEGDQFSGAGE